MCNTSAIWLFRLTRQTSYLSTFAMFTKWKSQKCTFCLQSFRAIKRLHLVCFQSVRWSLALCLREATVFRSLASITPLKSLEPWLGMLTQMLASETFYAWAKISMRFWEMRSSNRAWWDLTSRMSREREKVCGSLYSELMKNSLRENSSSIISSSSSSYPSS